MTRYWKLTQVTPAGDVEQLRLPAFINFTDLEAKLPYSEFFYELPKGSTIKPCNRSEFMQGPLALYWDRKRKDFAVVAHMPANETDAGQMLKEVS